jgi:biofilm protein TabA
MIIDSYNHIQVYRDILPYMDEGIEALKELGDDLQPGSRHEFKHGYFMIQEGDTKPMEEGAYEAHRKYIDVQILLDGEEEIAWSDIKDLETSVPYDEEKDAERLTGPKHHHILISKGMFWAAFPRDAHRPVSHTRHPHHYRKVVMKLPVKK